MPRIFGLIVLVIDILIIIDILKTPKDTEKKVLWIVAVVFLPILGPILYIVFGRK